MHFVRLICLLLAVQVFIFWHGGAAHAQSPKRIIREIKIFCGNVFDRNYPQFQKFPFSWANRLHRTTRQAVIARELLVAAGDSVNLDLLEETARNLRALPFLKEAEIDTQHIGAREVDVIVKASDRWTTAVGGSFSRAGGQTSLGLRLEEKNFAGFGQQLYFSYSESDIIAREMKFAEPRLFGSRVSMTAIMKNHSHGRLYAFSAARPFYSTVTRWSSGLYFDYFKGRKLFYDDAEEVFDFPVEENTVDAYFSRLIDRANSKRLSIDYYTSRSFFSSDVRAAKISRIDYGQLTVSLSRLRPQFARLHFIDGFGEIEDVSLGTGYTVAAGLAHPGLRDAKRAGYFHFEAAHNRLLGASGFGRIASRFSARTAESKLEALWCQFDVHASTRIGSWQTLAGRLMVDVTRDFPASEQIFLDGGKHVRGYRLHQEEGQNRWLCNLEDRLFSHLQIYKVRFGAVLFFDVGGVWRGGVRPKNQNILAAFGVGLRISPYSAYGGKLTRIDFALPVTGERALQISISTDQFFNAIQQLSYIFPRPRLFLSPR
jgi:hemolysin activation/secretion protein